VDQQRQLPALTTCLEVDREHLADAPHTLDRGALERVQRRIEGLERRDAGGQRRLHLGSGHGGGETARGDLDLGQLGHGSSVEGGRAPPACRLCPHSLFASRRKPGRRT
jgi:hypothetical protein